MSQTEIAKSLNQPLGTMKDRIRTGMMHLKKMPQAVRGVHMKHHQLTDELRRGDPLRLGCLDEAERSNTPGIWRKIIVRYAVPRLSSLRRRRSLWS
jgi:hypothetical protein